MLQNYIYFGNSENPVIYIYDKTNIKNISSYRLSGVGGVTDMAMFVSDTWTSAGKLVSVFRLYS